MMAEANDTAAKVCKALQDEHEKRAKYFKQGKVQKYALRDTAWVERHHKDVLSRDRQASSFVPGVIVRKVGQDVYAVPVGDNKILDRDHTQLHPRASDPSGRPLTFEQGWYNTVRVMYCIVPIQYCKVMYCISNLSGKVLFAHRSYVPLLCRYSLLVYTLQLLAISMACLS